MPFSCAVGDSPTVTLQVAATVALAPPDDSVDTNHVLISGTGTISSFGVGAVGVPITKEVHFKPSGGNITVVNGAALVLIGGVNRTVAHDSVGTYHWDGVGKWSERSFQDTTGAITASGGINSNGQISINNPWPSLLLIKPASGTSAQINSYTGTTSAPRWSMAIGDNTAESGSNAGSDFSLSRFDDTGTFLGSPFSIIRATGNATFSGLVTAGPAGAGQVVLNPGNATNTGYISFFNAAGTRCGYLGWAAGGVLSLVANEGTSTTLSVSGSETVSGSVTVNGGNVSIKALGGGNAQTQLLDNAGTIRGYFYYNAADNSVRMYNVTSGVMAFVDASGVFRANGGHVVAQGSSNPGCCAYNASAGFASTFFCDANGLAVIGDADANGVAQNYRLSIDRNSYLSVSGGAAFGGGVTFNSNITVSGNTISMPVSGGYVFLYGQSGLYADASYMMIGDSTNAAASNAWKYYYTKSTGQRNWVASDGTNRFQISPGGACICPGGFATGSDANMKRDIEPAPHIGLDALRKITPSYFHRIHSEMPEGMTPIPDRREFGFIAQDVQEALPDAVILNTYSTPYLPEGETDHGKMKTIDRAHLAIDPMPLLAALVNTVKQLDERIARLESWRDGT
jgi:hypothetical protein